MWIKRFFQVFVLILAVAFVGGCGVSNESSTGISPEGGSGTKSISGYVIDDPVPNATIKLFDSNGEEIGTTSSDDNGYFSIAGVRLKEGNTYCLEAEGSLSNQTINMHSCFSLTENVTEDNITVNINPLTEIAYKLYKEKGNLPEAETKVREYFQIPTGRWLGEVNYSDLQGISEGLHTLAELKGKNLPVEVADLIVSDIANDTGSYRSLFEDTFKIVPSSSEAEINHPITVSIVGGTKYIANGFEIRWYGVSENVIVNQTSVDVTSDIPGDKTLTVEVVKNPNSDDEEVIATKSVTINFYEIKEPVTLTVENATQDTEVNVADDTTVKIPAGAIPEGTTITFKEVVKNSSDTYKAFILEPSGMTFSEPVEIRIKYDPALVPDPRTLQVVRKSDDGSVDVLKIKEIDYENHEIVFETEHFSKYDVKNFYDFWYSCKFLGGTWKWWWDEIEGYLEKNLPREEYEQIHNFIENYFETSEKACKHDEELEKFFNQKIGRTEYTYWDAFLTIYKILKGIKYFKGDFYDSDQERVLHSFTYIFLNPKDPFPSDPSDWNERMNMLSSFAVEQVKTFSKLAKEYESSGITPPTSIDKAKNWGKKFIRNKALGKLGLGEFVAIKSLIENGVKILAKGADAILKDASPNKEEITFPNLEDKTFPLEALSKWFFYDKTNPDPWGTNNAYFKIIEDGKLDIQGISQKGFWEQKIYKYSYLKGNSNGEYYPLLFRRSGFLEVGSGYIFDSTYYDKAYITIDRVNNLKDLLIEIWNNAPENKKQEAIYNFFNSFYHFLLDYYRYKHKEEALEYKEPSYIKIEPLLKGLLSGMVIKMYEDLNPSTASPSPEDIDKEGSVYIRFDSHYLVGDVQNTIQYPYFFKRAENTSSDFVIKQIPRISSFDKFLNIRIKVPSGKFSDFNLTKIRIKATFFDLEVDSSSNGTKPIFTLLDTYDTKTIEDTSIPKDKFTLNTENNKYELPLGEIFSQDDFGVIDNKYVIAEVTLQYTYKGIEKIYTKTYRFAVVSNQDPEQVIIPPSTSTIKSSVKDAYTLEPIENATIILSPVGFIRYTDESGNYEFTNLAPGTYTIEVYKEGYIPVTGQVTLEEGETKVFEALLTLDTEHAEGNGTLTGTIKDALSGNGIANATIEFRKGQNILEGEPIATTATDSNGQFSIELPAGTYTGLAKANGYIQASFTFVVIANETTTKDISLSPVLPENEIRIVLTWGETPRDLDSHLVKVKDGSMQYHLYYPYAQSNGGDPWEEVDLDVDDTTSFGPETITIYNLDTNATYKYYVHDYSTYSGDTSTALANSGATVKVYWGDRTYTYYVPNLPGTAWKVFEIVNGTLVPCTGDDCVFGVSSETDSQFGTRAITSINTDTELFKNLPAK